LDGIIYPPSEILTLRGGKIELSPFPIVETKGRENYDDRKKIKRLKIWCANVNANQDRFVYLPVYVKQEKWDKYKDDIKTFEDAIKIFKVISKRGG